MKYTTVYLVKDKFDSPNQYSETDIIQMGDFFLYNIYVEFGGHVYQQLLLLHWVPIGTIGDRFVIIFI